MTPHAASRFEKANRFLAQLAHVSPDLAPEASIHLAYYAMVHAAAAVLLDRTGNAPKTHSALIGQFSKLILDDAQHGRKFGRSFNQAEKLRYLADYEDKSTPTVAEAAELRTLAIDFVAYCRSLLWKSPGTGTTTQ